MSNRDVAAVFEQIADLLEIQQADGFRVNSYRRVARIIDDLTEDLAAIDARDGLEKVPGIGKGSAGRIREYLQTGRIATHQELVGQTPGGLPRLLEVRGLGPKKVALLWKRLGVTSLDDLAAAIESGKLVDLPGLGAKSVEQIKAGLAFLRASTGRTPLGIARTVADATAAEVRRIEGVRRAEIAGSCRRGCETIGDLDLLCEAADGPAVIEAFTKLPAVEEVLAAGQTKGSVVVSLADGGRLQADLRVVAKAEFGAALQYFTGSKDHNVRLRERAGARKLKLNEYGLFAGERRVAGAEEQGLYSKLGLAFVPAELREDRGEVAAAAEGRLPDLVTLDDVRGDLHCHTVASDGHNTIEEMAAAAKQRGYEYLAIADHTASSAIAHGLSPQRMAEQIETIRRADKQIEGLRLLVSCEVDILADGRLDYPDELLAECDIVTASIHSALTQDRKKVTARSVRAIEHPQVDILGHPTGRLLGRRDAMDLDMAAVIAAAAAHGKALELNASWQRLDLKDTHVRQAVEAGVTVAVCTDAHSIDQLDQMGFGITTARRGWATADTVLNARPLAALRAWLTTRHG